MVPDKSLDVCKQIIAALLCDIFDAHTDVFNTKARRLTLRKVERRVDREGLGFLTKTLPRLVKAFDKAISGHTNLNATDAGFKSLKQSSLPIFMGELFKQVLQPNGALLHNPCAKCVRSIRMLLLFYKYELPYSEQQEQAVIDRFKQTEDELKPHCDGGVTSSPDKGDCGTASTHCDNTVATEAVPKGINLPCHVIRKSRMLLDELFKDFDPQNICPRHGPGAVATKQQLWEKFRWTNVAAKITDLYPFDAYFCASNGHVCDSYTSFADVSDEDLPARVVLVPKDSRGPRLISCEPVDKQWVQQGLGRAIVRLVEEHPLTKWNVRFTDQRPNQLGALLGSETGRYSTLDLNEASDRVSLDLVRLLFPIRILPYLEATRSCSTVLPNGEELQLLKFAPMGSALCFPILALTIWSVLAAGAPDADTREGIAVYGDDVIVPRDYTQDAIELLLSAGLKLNPDKCCTKGLFRESCGVDAFKGNDVTPVRIRTLWSSHRRADVYTSWVAYANSFWGRSCHRTYNLIVGWLVAIYGTIPGKDMCLTCPSLSGGTEGSKPLYSRTNKDLQKVQYRVWEAKAPAVEMVIDGWSMLLRYFTEGCSDPIYDPAGEPRRLDGSIPDHPAFSVSRYTKRRTSMLVRRWR